MSGSSDLARDVERLLRSRGVSWGDVGLVLGDVKTNYSQFSLYLQGDEIDEFLDTFKRVLYFALFAHAPTTPAQVESKFAAWEWVKEYAKKYLNAPDDAVLIRGSSLGAWPMCLTVLSSRWAGSDMRYAGRNPFVRS